MRCNDENNFTRRNFYMVDKHNPVLQKVQIDPVYKFAKLRSLTLDFIIRLDMLTSAKNKLTEFHIE